MEYSSTQNKNTVVQTLSNCKHICSHIIHRVHWISLFDQYRSSWIWKYKLERPFFCRVKWKGIIRAITLPNINLQQKGQQTKGEKSIFSISNMIQYVIYLQQDVNVWGYRFVMERSFLLLHWYSISNSGL